MAKDASDDYRVGEVNDCAKSGLFLMSIVRRGDFVEAQIVTTMDYLGSCRPSSRKIWEIRDGAYPY